MSSGTEHTHMEREKEVAQEKVSQAQNIVADVLEQVQEKAHEAAERTKPIAKKEAGHAAAAIKSVDKTILRLNKLLATPAGLASFLSTSNYILYILAYLHSKPPILQKLAHKLLTILKPTHNTPKLLATQAGPSPIASAAALLSTTRTTLRLLGLFPLYAWLRSLSSGPRPGADKVLHKIAVTQCLSYITYQFLENVSVLADQGIVPPSFIALLNRNNPSTARVYKWAYTFWLTGVSCDFIRLAREFQIEHHRRSVRTQMRAEGKAVAEYQDEEDRVFDKRWVTDLMIASAWFPMALHFSTEKGVPGWNLGIMGICGLFAGGGRMAALWRGTME